MKTITTTEFRDILKAHGVENINLADREYKLMTEKDIKKMKRLLWLISLLPYKPESRDCDDYSDFAKAVIRFFFGNIAFGVIWAHGLGNTAGYHSANFFMDENKKLHVYEPQNAKIYDFKPTGAFIKTFA